MTAKDLIKKLMNTPFRAREGSGLSKHYPQSDRVFFINDIIEKNISVTIGKPKRIGFADFAWVPYVDLIVIEKEN